MSRDATSGKFISFEGGEGTGKTTQIRKLADYLENRGDKIIITREPGGSEGAEKIRKLLLSQDNSWDALTELYLLLAARHDHIEQIILPALQNGEWVLCDRFHLSTIAYQGYGGGLDVALIELLSQAVLQKAQPTAVILLDMEPQIGLQRVAARKGEETRFDKMDLAYHRRVRQGFLDSANMAGMPPVFVIEADNDEQAVFDDILEALSEIDNGVV